MNYFIYNTTTGEILSRNERSSLDEVTAPDGCDFYLNAQNYPGATHIINNAPVTVPKSDKPLDVYKLKQRAAINKARDAAELQPFGYLGKQFDADPVSVKRLTLAIQAAQSALLVGQSFSITWTCADNTTIDLTETQILGALQAMMLRGVELHETARGLKAQIDAATTVAEVEAITWPIPASP